MTMNESVAKATVALLQRTYESDRTKSEKVITFYGGEPLLNYNVIKVIMQEIEETKKITLLMQLPTQVGNQ